MHDDASRAEVNDLLAKLSRHEGTIEEIERWLARVLELDPRLLNSDMVHSLQTSVKAHYIAKQLTAEMGEKLSKEQLVSLVARVQEGEGSEEELEALLMLIDRNVPDPNVRNLIFYSPQSLTPEEVIERAFAYRPIVLGPRTDEQ